MPDDKAKKGQADRQRVAGTQPHEVAYVAKKTGKSAEAVRAAARYWARFGTGRFVEPLETVRAAAMLSGTGGGAAPAAARIGLPEQRSGEVAG